MTSADQDGLRVRIAQLEHQIAAAARNARHRGQHLVEALDVVTAILDARGEHDDPAVRAMHELVAEARATAKDLVHEVTQDAIAWGPLDLAEIVRAAAGRVWKQPGTVVLDVRELPTGAFGEASAIEGVFVELFQNATEFHEGAGPPRIVVDGRITATDLRIGVEDDGPGIEPEDRRRVFAYDVDGADPRYGVGLALVATVMQGHGGRVWCEDGIALSGARFVLVFPLRPELHE